MIKLCEESYTTNLRQQCYNESVVARGDKPLSKWQWYAFVEKRRIVEGQGKMMGKEQNIREMWASYCRERLRVKKSSERMLRKASRNTGPVAA